MADETWHPGQKARFEDGHCVLEIAHADSRELVGDILRHGPEVVVLSQPALREELSRRLEAALEHYQDQGGPSRAGGGHPAVFHHSGSWIEPPGHYVVSGR